MIEHLLAPIATLTQPLVKHWLDQRANIPAGVSLNWKNLQQGIKEHLEWILKWSSMIQIKDMAAPKLLSEVFIESNIESIARTVEIKPQRLLAPPSNYLVLGPLGIGKTTLVKYVTHSLLMRLIVKRSDPSFPVVVRLKEVSDSDNIFTAVLNAIQVLEVQDQERLGNHVRSDALSKVLGDAVVRFVRDSRCLLLLDGIDELPRSARPRLISQISLLSTMLPCQVIATCRSGGYVVTVEGTETLSIEAFTEKQFIEYCKKSLPDENSVAGLLAELATKPYRPLATQPLQAATLCAIYEADGELPQENIYIYEKTVNMRLRDWDQERNVARKSSFKRFGPDEKKKFLCALAFALAALGRGETFSQQDFIRIYNRLRLEHRLPENAAVPVLNEIEAFTGLIAEERRGRYEFVHKTIYEFLLGSYFASSPRLPTDPEILFNNPDALALATILSTNSDVFFFNFVDTIFRATRVGGVPDALSVDDLLSVYFDRLKREEGRFHGDQTVGYAMCYLMTMLYPRSISEVCSGYLSIPGMADGLKRALEELSGQISLTGSDWINCRHSKATPFVSDDLGKLTLESPLHIEARAMQRVGLGKNWEGE
jgi:predicted NACHT family NTPase